MEEEMKDFRAKLDYVLKHNIAINKMFNVTASTFIKMMGLFIPVDKKAILFSAHGRKYNDSPKEIYEYLLAHPEYKDYKFYWAIEDDDKTEIPGEHTIVKPDTVKYFRTALKCKYWVTCVNIERSLKFKRHKTVYLNTWHGIPIKTVGNEAKGRKDYDFSYINFFCISGEYEIDVYKRSFNLSESQLLKCGMPRNDVLYNTTEDEILAIKERLGLPLNKKILLYAPTWRDSKDGGKSYQIKPPINLTLWEQELGEDYVLLFRTHPYTNELLGVHFNAFVRDYTNYPNINDLMKIADVLISDYSATIFDYAILERPIICFAYDLEEYSHERGFAIDIRVEMPGGIMATEEDVIARIRKGDVEEECAAVRAFKQKYIEHGGNATEVCVKAMFSK